MRRWVLIIFGRNIYMLGCYLFFCKQNLLIFIQPRWQPRRYLITIMSSFLMNLHSPSKSNTNSTQILGFILIRLSPMTGHFHTCTLQRMQPIYYFPLNSWLSLQGLCRLLWGLTIKLKPQQSTPRECRSTLFARLS